MAKKPTTSFVAHGPNKRFGSLKITVARTMDDFLIKPAYSKYPPGETITSSWITKNVPILVPVLSAPMKTVTEDAMAIAMAKAGAAGVIHYDMTPEQQAKKVARVRFEQQCYIASPVPVYEHTTLAEYLAHKEEWAKKGNKSFDKQHVLNRDQEVVGFIAETDLQYCKDKSRKIGKLMRPLRKLVTAKPGTTQEEAYKIMQRERVSSLLVMGRNRKNPGMYLFKDLQRRFENDDAGYNVDRSGRLIVGAAVGVSDAEFERAKLLVAAGVTFLVIDCSHAHTDAARKQLRRFKRAFDVDVMVGNIATREAGIFLAKAGADGLKVGIGPGSICTTRDVAGVGVPQMDAVMDVVDGVRRFNIPVCADGGISKLGQFGKLLTYADSAMVGNYAAGTTEAAGGVIVIDGVEYRAYSGMAAPSVMRSEAGALRYRQSKKVVPEGADGGVPDKGPVGDIIKQIGGAIQLTLGLVGARTIADLHERARLVQITHAGAIESTTHNIVVARS